MNGYNYAYLQNVVKTYMNRYKQYKIAAIFFPANFYLLQGIS